MSKKASEIVRNYLVLRAEKMTEHPEMFTQEEGKSLDRALRSCPAIKDIDTVWIRWHSTAEKFGWLTDNELAFNWKKGYYYPNI